MPLPPLSMILALGANGALGRGGKLPWSYPEDRAHFERTTRGHAVIMGRRTWEEEGTPLPDRTNIVVSRSFESPADAPGVLVARSLGEAIARARTVDDAPFVIGGAGLFKEALSLATRIYLTEIPEAPEADVFFMLDRDGLSVVDERVGEGGLRFLVLDRDGSGAPPGRLAPMPFDSAEFNERLFYPRPDVTPCPPGAVDLFVPVPRAELHVRIHPAAGARAAVLLFHGNGEVVGDYDEAAGSYARAGASLAVVDYRGYGASTGAPTLRRTIADAPLVLAAVSDWLAAHAGEAGPAALVVMGRSLGSACAAELYGTRPPSVAGFILESGSSDLAGLVRRRGLPVPPALDPDDVATFDPVPKLARGAHPLLVLHGAGDDLIAPSEAERAFEAAGTADKRLVLIPGHGHNDVSRAPLYWSALRDFLAALGA